MIPRYRAWHKTWEEMGRITFIRYKKSGEIFHLSFRRNIYNGNIYGGLVKLDEIELMQSTGLVDKNGKEIFEGDIVKCNGLLGTIESFKAMWVCSFVKYNNYQKLGFFVQEIEVVGNVYENPELLEAEE